MLPYSFACMKPGDTFLGLDLAHGGHLSHGSPVNLSGINYHPVAYHVKEETGMVDYDEMEQLALEHKPKLIVSEHPLILAIGITNVCAKLLIK